MNHEVPLPPATECGDEQKRGQHADAQEPDLLAHGRSFREVEGGESHSAKLIGIRRFAAVPSGEGI